MIKTPDFGHVSRAPFKNLVYEPAEDTFALLDALEHDVGALRQLRPTLVVEIGCGSGCVSAFVAECLQSAVAKTHTPSEPHSASSASASASAAFLCTDINVNALQATRQTGTRNGNRQLDVVQTSLVHGLLPRCTGKVDLLLFNPPYVPTTDEEERAAQQLASIQGSWAGGPLGTALLETLLPLVSDLLSANGGRMYFVAIKQNDPDALVLRLNQLGLLADICLSRRAGREHLFIIRVIRP